MFESLFIIGFVLILMVILTLVFIFLSEKRLDSREKRSPYECGFDPSIRARSTFSVRFFLLGVYFVVFDVELSLLVPVVSSVVVFNSIIGFMRLFFFIFVLFVGIFHEYREGSLEWVI